nr:ribonuclease H-like domain-containing protein [Tanacetum cinerariifolium]
HAEGNNDNQAEEEHSPDDEFTNPFCAPTQKVTESSSHNIGNSNVPTFNQPQVSEYQWKEDHPLEQVHGNPSRPVQTSTQVISNLLDGHENGTSQWSTEGGGLWYPKGSSFGLTAFLDANHAGCIDTSKSTSGGIQFLGDKLVNWMSKKQNCTTMSSAEAEYMALSASRVQVM